MNNSLVSVIIPTYKRPILVKRAIISVLNQTYKNIEVIVVDDNDPMSKSRQMTLETMKEFITYKNVKYITHKENKNGSAARNTGIKASNGEYLMFLDDDDEFFPNKVESQINTLHKLDATWGCCYSNYIKVSDNKLIQVNKESREGNLLVEELMRNFFVHAGSNLMIRRNVVQDIGGFNEGFKRNQDIEFLVRVLSRYKIAYVDELGLKVHRDGFNSNSNYIDTTNYYLKVFEDLIKTLSNSNQQKIHKMISLQTARYYFMKFKFISLFKHIKTKKISLLLVIRYFLHLLRRKIKRESYGFKLN